MMFIITCLTCDTQFLFDGDKIASCPCCDYTGRTIHKDLGDKRITFLDSLRDIRIEYGAISQLDY